MKFFVYTIGSPGARYAGFSEVNAQPLREVLSMMTIRAGVLYLSLPRIVPVDDVQGGAFPISQWTIAEDLPQALSLSALPPAAFKALMDRTEEKKESVRHLNQRLSDLAIKARQEKESRDAH